MADLLAANEANVAVLDGAITVIVHALQSTYICGSRVVDEAKTRTSFPSYAFATLPHAAGIHLPDEAVELVCTATISVTTFWQYLAERLNLDDDVVLPKDGKSLQLRLGKLQALRNVDLGVHRQTSIVFRYSRLPKDFHPAELPLPTRAFLLGDPDPLTKVYDTQFLLHKLDGTRSLNGILNARLAFLRLHQWADRCGLYAPHWSLLNAECLFHWYARTLFENEGSEDLDPAQILRQVLVGSMSTCSLLPTGMIITAASGRNAAGNVCPEAAHTLKSTINHVDRILNSTSKLELPGSRRDGLAAFVARSQDLVEISARCWSSKQYLRLVPQIHDLICRLRRDIRTSTKGTYGAYVWPFSLADEQDRAEGGLVHLIDIHRTAGNGSLIKDSKAPDAPALLKALLAQLELESNTFYIDIARVSREEVTWQRLSSQESTGPSTSTSQCADTGAIPVGRTTLPTSSVETPNAKFRTAASVMNRLRWDETHQQTDYEIGYVDRFTEDLIWKPLEKWEKMTEEEDFVPEHRIRQFRRVDDAVVVWDRDRRFDGTGG